MSLIDNMMEQCILLEKERTPDGAGGFLTVWKDGAEFMAAVTLDTTLQARIAEKEGVKNVYTVTTKKNVGLMFHDVFKRSDGSVFRITSDSKDKQSPSASTLNIRQASAEKWELEQ